ncbi:hypothetical protein EDI_189900 [Entamoeba dispar SAW760]|uniref:Uncharacterized protein n=1 Tax=Entamoeba dispar (strain ATCC PRA-260 / SAW760) TaxID=370354 RepID=B0ETR5_ENTDS|nr:uncharacterized protein EDI_189900 [Entamoeba dispar SAW760]EDR22083.1 hypothetical protein EDI_189900 [Entamoeba dispar SAW760]|eukprot:EDR22083.1 hypothetical protein EDI_189900 [Entamoeba dispar SAW760]
MNGNNKLKHSLNPTNKPLTLIINGILTCNSFVNNSLYYFTNSSSSTQLININNNGNNNIMIFDETVTLNGQLSNCIVLTGKTNKKFKCIECEKGYYLNSNKECQILPDNCIVGYKTYCYQCKEGFIKEKGECKEIDNKCNKSERNYCLKCSNGYKIENNQCNGDNEDQCYYEGNKCVSCSNRYTLNNKKCSNKEKNQNGKNEEIYCENGKYIDNNNKCIECSKSEICKTNDIEIKCKYEEYLDNNKCINKTCEEDMIKDQNGKCNNNIQNCLNKSYVNGKCVECSNTYSPNFKGECINTKIEYCEEENTYGCKRCKEGYYLTKDKKCLKCDDKCETCYGTSTYCMSCSNDKYLRNDKTCQSNEELNGTCLRILADGSGCGICKNGYYRNGKGCSKCEKECLTCNQKDKCIICGEGYFMSSTGICKSTTTIKGCKGEIDKEYGCRECLTGYYLINKECSKCGNKCITCLNEKECNTCEDEYIIINKECIHYSNINKCKETKNNKCSKCSFWYGINEEGTKCNKEIVWWMIMIIIIIILIIIIIIIIIIITMINYIIKLKEKKEQEKTTTIFKISQSNIKFISLGDGIITNKKEIEIGEGEEIEVNKEIRELILVKKKMKNIQLEQTQISLQLKEDMHVNLKYLLQSNVLLKLKNK